MIDSYGLWLEASVLSQVDLSVGCLGILKMWLLASSRASDPGVSEKDRSQIVFYDLVS